MKPRIIKKVMLELDCDTKDKNTCDKEICTVLCFTKTYYIMNIKDIILIKRCNQKEIVTKFPIVLFYLTFMREQEKLNCYFLTRCFPLDLR